MYLFASYSNPSTWFLVPLKYSLHSNLHLSDSSKHSASLPISSIFFLFFLFRRNQYLFVPEFILSCEKSAKCTLICLISRFLHDLNYCVRPQQNVQYRTIFGLYLTPLLRSFSALMTSSVWISSNTRIFQNPIESGNHNFRSRRRLSDSLSSFSSSLLSSTTQAVACPHPNSNHLNVSAQLL